MRKLCDVIPNLLKDDVSLQFMNGSENRNETADFLGDMVLRQLAVAKVCKAGNEVVK